MSKLINRISEQLNIERDIQSISGYTGVDKLNELKRKYKDITLDFKKTIKKSPNSMKTFIEIKDLSNYLNGLFEKFDSNTINISVVAEVSSGKSTFLNALIFGKKVLDAKMGETTAKVFKISYGENVDSDELKEKISKINTQTKNKISKENFALEDININDYIVNLTSNNENLKKGIVLYDTPGFGTLHEKVMSKLIKEAVNRSDAVILLLDISKGLKKDEARFIQEALSYIKENKRFIVLNKFDAAIDEDEDEQEIQEQINKVVSDTKTELMNMSKNIDKSVLDRQTYYLSAIKALSGKSKNNLDNLNFSRFPIFEESFWNRIVESKKEIFEDNVRDLVQESVLILEESENKIKSFQTTISQTNDIVIHMEKVSKEIKKFVSTQYKILSSLEIELDKNSNIVSDEVFKLENEMKKVIENISKNALSNIPNDNVQQKDFEYTYKKAIEEINKKFVKKYNNFTKTINDNIIKKEKKVNYAIDTLNNEMKDEKFKKLNLQEIPRIQKPKLSTETKNMKTSANVTFSIQEDKIDENLSYYPTTATNLVEKDDTAASTAAGATVGGTAGAAIGSVIPILGTGAGAGIGTAIGAILGGIFGSGNKEAELEAQHEKKMQEMRIEHERLLAKERYKNQVAQAKRDLLYELKNNSNEYIYSFITKEKNNIDNRYRTMLTEAISVVFNAKNILKDMQTIIEDPSEQQSVIEKNEENIKEMELFIQNIEQCFQL